MLSEALTYPRRGDGWLKRIGIGGILYFLGFLVIPQVIVEGYLYRVLREAVHRNPDPPEWEGWAELLVDGIKMLIIQFLYVLAPVVVFVLGGAMGAAGLDAVGTLFTVVGAILSLVVFYLVPAAVTNFARTGEFGDAFAIGTLGDIVLTRTYFVHVVLSVVVGIVLGIIGLFLMVFLVGLFVLFYAQVAIYYLWARGVARSLDRSTTPA